MFPDASLKTARSFAVHYGENNIKNLSAYDIAIVEPKAHSVQDIQILKNSGALVFAYLSVFESDRDQPENEIFRGHALKEAAAGSDKMFMDLRSETWMEYLYGKVKNLIEEDAYDGIFVDTLSYIEECIKIDSVMFAQILAVCDFFKRIRESFPGVKIIQNNALAVLLNYSAPLIDGICWENPERSTAWAKKLNRKVIKKLNAIQSQHDLSVMLLTEEAKDTGYYMKIARKNGYLYYDAPKDYIGSVNNGN